ncbi:MAG: Hsp33 family molecular chaperone HslO [Enterobacteriaceae bacterium]
MSIHDQLHRYLFNHHSVRGELVTVSETLQPILANHHYPLPVERLLAEMLVATSLLTATLKFSGHIAMQLQGDGPLSLAVINGNHHQEMRGVARVKGEISEQATLKEMIGNGVLVITLTPSEGERYQGIVPLEGDTIAQLLENYFLQSEQLPTRLFIHCSHQQTQWQAGGMLLQVLPVAEARLEHFEHLSVLTETLTDQELFTLTSNQLLYRLYHQEEVTLLGSQPVSFRCHCSRERTSQALLSIERQEVEQILQQEGKIDMQCDYCGTHYLFTAQDIIRLYQEDSPNS